MVRPLYLILQDLDQVVANSVKNIQASERESDRQEKKFLIRKQIERQLKEIESA